MMACISGELEDIQSLLNELKNKKIDINVQDVNKKTGLHYAVENNQESAVKYLLENNANANLSHFHNCTPLHISSQRGYIPITELLLSNGAKTDLRDNDGDTPLLCCAFGGNVEIAKMLLQKDPSAILSINSKKDSVLHYSAEAGHLDMTRFLLSQGASKLLKNSEDKTPEQVAMDNNFGEIAKVIADYSSNFFNRSPTTSTPRVGASHRQSSHRSNSSGSSASDIPKPMQLIQCPLCSRSFENQVIELHSANCNGKPEEVVTIPDDDLPRPSSRSRKENSKVACPIL